jgi:hypothetical protein
VQHFLDENRFDALLSLDRVAAVPAAPDITARAQDPIVREALWQLGAHAKQLAQLLSQRVQRKRRASGSKLCGFLSDLSWDRDKPADCSDVAVCCKELWCVDLPAPRGYSNSSHRPVNSCWRRRQTSMQAKELCNRAYVFSREAVSVLPNEETNLFHRIMSNVCSATELPPPNNINGEEFSSTVRNLPYRQGRLLPLSCTCSLFRRTL